MGTLLSRPSRPGPNPEQSNNAPGAVVHPAGPVKPGDVIDTDLRLVDEVFGRILDLLGPGRIEQATVTQMLVLHPCRLEQGEKIARELGLDSPLDHRRSIPGYTIWSGVYLGVEVQVRASLRRPVGSDL